jgi:hypothetical protein
MATVIQRCLNAGSTGGGEGFGISEAEKTQLLNDINKLNDNSKE